MKPTLTPIKCLGAIALLAVAVGCASTSKTGQILSAAGFKTVAAGTASQQQQLKALPPDKVTMVKRSGKTYYVFPDPAHNQIYVGSPKQYRAYQQMLLDNKIAVQNRIDVELNEDAALSWD